MPVLALGPAARPLGVRRFARLRRRPEARRRVPPAPQCGLLAAFFRKVGAARPRSLPLSCIENKSRTGPATAAGVLERTGVGSRICYWGCRECAGARIESPATGAGSEDPTGGSAEPMQKRLHRHVSRHAVGPQTCASTFASSSVAKVAVALFAFRQLKFWTAPRLTPHPTPRL
jgi:hypothetical protein